MCARAIGLLFALSLAGGACGGEGENPYQKPLKKTRSLDELAAAQPKMSPEELAAARKKAGFKTESEIAKENAAMFEKGAREYVKARLKKYRAFAGDFGKMLDQVEKNAGKWAESDKGKKGFEKFNDGYKEDAKAFADRFDELTGHGAEGGQTQVVLGKAFRTWDDRMRDLGPDIAKQDRFGETLTEIRAELKKLKTALDEIEKDESLVVSKLSADKK